MWFYLLQDVTKNSNLLTLGPKLCKPQNKGISFGVFWFNFTQIVLKAGGTDLFFVSIQIS